MEDEEDYVSSPSSKQSQQPEFEVPHHATENSPEIPSPMVTRDVIDLPLVQYGEVENGDWLELKRILPEVDEGDELGGVEVAKIEGNEIGGNADELNGASDDGGVDGGNNVEKGGVLEEECDEEGLEIVMEVLDDLIEGGVGVEAVERGIETEEVNVAEEEQVRVDGSEVEMVSELIGDGVGVEAVERGIESKNDDNKSENVENVNVVDEEQVRVDGIEVEGELIGDDVGVEAVERGIESKNVENKSENVENVNVVDEEQVRVDGSEVEGELIGDNVGVEAVKRGFESKNDVNENVIEEEQVRVNGGETEMVSAVQNELSGDGVLLEAVERRNASKNLENVTDMEEEQVTAEVLMPVNEEVEVRNEEVVQKDKEMGEGDDVMKNELLNTNELAEDVPEIDERESEGAKVEEGEGEEEDDVAKSDEPEIETTESSSGKRKRGKNGKPVTPRKAPPRRVVGEDECFICLDGGDLVLCDRRGCPKAYHPSCVDHDEEFFKTKDPWTCGWHLCNKCSKNAYYMCYTCQFSLCRACSKDADFFRVRGNKGLCESCMKTVMLIENSEQNEMGQDPFSDTSCWEYLFKDYWFKQKEKLCITSDEISRAKNQLMDSDKQQTSIDINGSNNDAGGDSDSSRDNIESTDPKRENAKGKPKSVDGNADGSTQKNASAGKKKSKRSLKSHAKEVDSDLEHSGPDSGSRKSKKARRLSKSHPKGYEATDDSIGGNTEWASKELLEFVMHMKNGDQSVLTQFDVQGLLLEYIKRNKLRDPRRRSQIICDSMLQKLFGKSRVYHFEMLTLLESHFFLKDAGDNQEMMQLDADDGTDSPQEGKKSSGKKPRKREQKGFQSNLDDYAAIDMHNINLIYLRRNVMEALLENPETFHDKVVGTFARIRIYGSNQKQEMYRLVQIIGTSKAAEAYKVGKRTTNVMLRILNLATTEIISTATISNQDFFEDECKRLRQSIKCGLINRMTVGDVVEKARDLHEARVLDWIETEIVRLNHLRDRASEKGRKKELRECVEKLQLLKTAEERQRRLDEIPEVHADPKMDPSFESDDELDTPRQADRRSREPGFTRKDRDYFSPHKGSSPSSDSWSANARHPTQKHEPYRNPIGKSFSDGRKYSGFTSPTREHTASNGVDKGTPKSNSLENSRVTPESSIQAKHSVAQSDIPSVAGQTSSKVNETEKTWHYRDPSGKVQGPFSITQLRKWNSTGYFPIGLKVWKISQTENDSILLTDILTGRVDKEVPSVKLNSNADPRIKSVSSSVNNPKLSSPTPARSSSQPSNYSTNMRESVASCVAQPTSSQYSISTSVPRSVSSSSSVISNTQQMASQSTVQMGSQPYNQANLSQGVSNVVQPGNGQNPPVYNHGWSTVTPNNPNLVPAQVGYGQSVSNQPPPYNGGYTGQGNIAANNMTGMPTQNAWRPAQTNMVRPGPPIGAPGGTTTTGWLGPTPSPSAGNTNSGQVAPPGNTGGQGGNRNRNGRVSRWDRPAPIGIGGQGSGGGGQGQGVCRFFHENGHCKKGASCNFMHA